MQIVTSKGTKKLHLWLDTVSTLLFSPNINAKIQDPSNKATRHGVTNNVCSFSIEVTKKNNYFESLNHGIVIFGSPRQPRPHLIDSGP